MGRKRCANPRFSRWLNSSFTGASGSSSSNPPSDIPASVPPEPADPPASPPPPPTEVGEYGLPPPSPPPDPSKVVDLEEEIDDAEYARRLHVALNKGPRGVPADAEVISIDDSSDDEPGDKDGMDADVPAESSSAAQQSTGAANQVLDSSAGGPRLPSSASPALSSEQGSQGDIEGKSSR